MKHMLHIRGERLRVFALRQLYNPRHKSRPVFLVGCGRSGTSLLIKQLDKSWRIEMFNEHHPKAFNNYRLRELNVIETLVDRSKAPITLFKPILSTTQTRNLLSRFPDARVIFAFRHYDDVINSSLKKFGVENRINHVRHWMEDDFSEFAFAPPPEPTKVVIRRLWKPSLTPESGAALYWLFYNRLFYDLDLAQDNRVFLVRYESLVTNPRQQIAALTEFLDFPFEEHMAEGVFSSSIKRDPTPTIDERIRAECDSLHWQLLQESSEG